MRTYPIVFLTLLATAWPCAAAHPATQPAIPAPYTPLKAADRELRCLGRKMELGALALPVQMTAADANLLAGPVRLISGPAEALNLKGQSRLVSNDGATARWEYAGESAALHATARMTAECDGFCWYEIELAPRAPLKLTELKLEIPRTRSTSKYLHTVAFTWGKFSQGLAENGGQWSGPFMPCIWLGDEARGLAWCCESDEGWRLKTPDRALDVRTSGDSVTFAATLIDHEVTLTAPVKLRFGLQATPVKPVSVAWRARARILHNIHYGDCEPGKDGLIPLDVMRDAGVKTVVYHDDWSDYYGKVSTPYDAQLRKLVDACHRRGMRLLVYIGYGLARHAPELQGHHDEWSVMPLIPWTSPYRTEFREFDATCARSGWTDWLVDGIDKLFTDYDLDGLYFDGTTEAWKCENAAHGCGWRDEDGHSHATYPLLAARQLMRRIADTVHKHKPDAILDAHMSGNFTVPTLSFCDSIWNGEQFEHYTAKDRFEIPLHAFRTEFMGYAYGLDAEFLCYVDRPFGFNEAIALAGLHGIEVRPYAYTLQYVAPIWKAMDAFGATAARWQPYWSGSGATADREAVKASAYVREGKALLFVSHLKRDKVETSLQLDRQKLGLGSGPLLAQDAITGAGVRAHGDSLAVSFDGMTYQLIEVRADR